MEKVLELVKGIKRRGEKVIIFSGLRLMVSAIAGALREEVVHSLGHKGRDAVAEAQGGSSEEN